MDYMVSLVLIIISGVLINNFVLSKFLGICPFIGVSKSIETSIGMAVAVIFVMVMASLVTFGIEWKLLVPYKLEYMRTVVYILVIAALVQFVEMVIQKTSPPLYQALGIYLPLITTNCAVLGLAILNISTKINGKPLDLLQSCVNALGAGAGFGLALIIFAGLREDLELAEVPAVLRGTPIAFITAGLLSLAFMGFSGLVAL